MFWGKKGNERGGDYERGIPVNLEPTVNSPSIEGRPGISVDGLLLLFISDWPGGYGVGEKNLTTRATLSYPWGSAKLLGSGRLARLNHS